MKLIEKCEFAHAEERSATEARHAAEIASLKNLLLDLEAVKKKLEMQVYGLNESVSELNSALASERQASLHLEEEAQVSLNMTSVSSHDGY